MRCHLRRTRHVAFIACALFSLGALQLTACGSTRQPGSVAGAPSSPATRDARPTALQVPEEPGRRLGVETRHMDRGTRPQEDFYQFVNGHWLETTVLPPHRTGHGTFDELEDATELQIRTLIEQAGTTANPPGSNAQKVGDLYKSFMDTRRIESLGLEPVRAELARVKAVKSTRELPELFAELVRTGVSLPFVIQVEQDEKQATRYIVALSQGWLGLPDRDYYSGAEPHFRDARAAYATYVEKLLTLAGERDARSMARAIVALETVLAANSWDRVRNRDREATYNLRSVAELEALTPGFSWKRFLSAAGAEATPAVVVRQPDYFQALDDVLKKTPLPVLRQYLVFKVLDARAPFLGEAFDAAYFDFRGRTLQGLKEDRPRWQRGISIVDYLLGEAVGQLYVERHFTPDLKPRVLELVARLREAFGAGIDSLDWMSPTTKAQARDKLAKLNVKIGHPERWRDYSSLELDAADLVGNLRRGEAFEFKRLMAKLGKPVDRDEWDVTPYRVDAFYRPSLNAIVFPAAILQPPFFDPRADDATNYGAIGAFIGHEISHAFDDQGSRSDGDGNLRDWWTPEDKARFQARAARLVEQYSAFSPLPGAFVNGQFTLGENIGDLSGVAVAWRAYQRSVQGKQVPVIDGFSGAQRFFLGWAQLWRARLRDEVARQRLMNDGHSPPKFRVNGVVRNLPEFHEAFSVKEGDGMWLPPEARVKLW